MSRTALTASDIGLSGLNVTTALGYTPLKTSNQDQSYADYSVPTATYIPITLPSGSQTLVGTYAYRVELMTSGTGTYSGAVYIVTQSGATWAVTNVSNNGTTSNHPMLRNSVDGTKLEVYHNHPSTYGIRVAVKTIYVGNAQQAITIFGLEGTIKVDQGTNVLISGNLGIGNTAPISKLHVSGDIQQDNAQFLKGKKTDGTVTKILGLSNDNVLYLGGIDTAVSGIAFIKASGSEAARFDSLGNFGLGAVPQTWSSAWRALQVGFASALYSRSSTTAISYLGTNIYTNSSGIDIYLSSDYATTYRQYVGAHAWFTAPSGTAGSTITWNQAMALDNGGNLMINTTSAAARLTIGSGASGVTLNDTVYIGGYSTTPQLRYIFNHAGSGLLGIGSDGVGSMVFGRTTGANGAVSSEFARFDPNGKFVLGGTTGYAPLHIYSNANNGLRIDGPNNSGNNYISFYGANAVRQGYIGMGGTSTDDNFYINNDRASASLIFSTVGAERARIDASGNIGLGITSPTARLHIKGTDGTYHNGLTIQSPNATQGLDILPGYALTNGTAGGVQSDTTMTLRSSGTLGGEIAFATGNSEVARMNNSGNWLFGTSTVQGRITAKGYITSISTSETAIGRISSADTGITSIESFYANGGSNIAFLTNSASGNGSVEVARLNNVGNFGLGTSSPSSYSHGGTNRVLEIYNANTTANSQSHVILSSGSTLASSSMGTLSFTMTGLGKLMSYIGSATPSTHTTTNPASIIKFATMKNGTLAENMILDDTGNLLVGTATTSSGVPNRDIASFSRNQNDFTQIVIDNQNQGTSANAALRMQAYGGTWIASVYSSTSFANPLTFSFNSTEYVRFTSSGKVGINTFLPDQRLSIASGSDTTGTGDGISFYGAYSNKQAAILSYNTGNYSGDLRFYVSLKSSPSTSVVEAMRIGSNGGLLISTTSEDASYKLQVNGNAKISGNVDTAGNVSSGNLYSSLTTFLGGATAGYSGFSSSLIVNYPGNGTQYGMILKPSSSTLDTNAITFLSGVSTYASPGPVGAIQHLANDGGLNLTGTWKLGGYPLLTSANVSGYSPALYSFNDTVNTSGWLKLGRLGMPQQGAHAVIKIYTGSGYNSNNAQDGEVFIHFKTSNGSSLNSNGFAGNAYYHKTGQNPVAVSGVKFVGNAAGGSATAYDVYINVSTFTGNTSFFSVETGTSSTFTVYGTMSTDPGVASSTVLVATEGYTLQSAVNGTLWVDGTNSPGWLTNGWARTLKVGGSTSSNPSAIQLSANSASGHHAIGNSGGSLYFFAAPDETTTSSATYWMSANSSGGVSFPSTAGVSVTGPLTTHYLYMDRANTLTTGIQWYSTSYTAWVDYMGNAGVANQGPRGNLTAPTGTLVTTWAKRSFIENAAGYGWTFESGTQNSTTPAIMAEISSSTGNARFAGSVTAANGLTVSAGVTDIQVPIKRATVQQYVEKRTAITAATNSATITLDTTTCNNFVLNLQASPVTLAFAAPGTGTDTFGFTLKVVNDATAGRTLVFPTAGTVIKWPNGTMPTRTTTANAVDWWYFWTDDNGTTWTGTLSAQDAR